MAGRPKIYDEDLILDKAIEVFWKKGYEVSSAEELLAAMGIGKGSFYLAFKKGKQELFEKTLQHFFFKNFHQFLKVLLLVENPVPSLKAFYYQMCNESSPVKAYGCYFCNAILQAEKEEVKIKASAIMVTISNKFAEALIQAKNKGVLSYELPDDLLPLYFLNLWSGLNTVRQIEMNPIMTKRLIDEHFKNFK